MIKPNQKQSVGTNGIAIQSAGDTTVNSGLTLPQMRQIVECIGDQLPKYAAIAATIVEDRLKHFEEKIISKFDADQTLKSDAFQDPDFQYLLRNAQHAYARSGEDAVAENLAILIGERSKISGQSRASLSINKAIECAPLLTKEEISIAAVSFLIRHVKITGVPSPQEVGTHYANYLSPFLDDLPSGGNAYLYMESLSCGVRAMGSLSAVSALAESYPKSLRVLRTRADLDAATSVEYAQSLIDAGIVFQTQDGVSVWRDIEGDKEFCSAVDLSGLDKSLSVSGFAATHSHPPNREQVIEKIEPYFRRVGEFMDHWDNSQLKHWQPSLTGIVIGYSSLKQRCNFDADVSMWIS
ncbi:LPO_1073/Vpar_1526 family protein [Sphingorhabdus sp.]|jgi:hypothetical protein|uniref:LPO_1073/Vpar_1526 family protein n=1 Tax=Sphingorhabdus sp. TaxID=1902408 RepID=UPI00378503BB